MHDERTEILLGYGSGGGSGAMPPEELSRVRPDRVSTGEHAGGAPGGGQGARALLRERRSKDYFRQSDPPDRRSAAAGENHCGEGLQSRQTRGHQGQRTCYPRRGGVDDSTIVAMEGGDAPRARATSHFEGRRADAVAAHG